MAVMLLMACLTWSSADPKVPYCSAFASVQLAASDPVASLNMHLLDICMCLCMYAYSVHLHSLVCLTLHASLVVCITMLSREYIMSSSVNYGSHTAYDFVEHAKTAVMECMI